jgi:hypothetical protein
MPFSFPSSPSVGQQSVQNGRTYSWSGSAWELVAASAASYTGSVTIPGLGDSAFANVSLLLHGEGATIADNSGTPKTFTTTGSVATSTARAKFGTGSLLIGASSTLTTNSSSDFAFGLGDFTVEAWMNFATLPTGESRLIRFGSDANQFFNLAYGASSNTFTIVNESVAHVLSTSQAVATNQWHHVAYTRSGNEVRLFFNGAMLGSVSISNVNTPATFMQLSAGDGSIYYDEVRATKGLARYIAAFSPPSAVFADASSITLPVTITAVTPAPPNAPTSLTATAGNAQIALAWTAPSAPGSSAITGYTVEYTPSGGSAATVSTGSTGTSYTLTGLNNGTAYTVRVRAVSAAGNGTYSGTVVLTTAVVQTLTSGGGNNSWRWQADGYVTEGIDDDSQFIVGKVDGTLLANAGWRTTGLGVKPSAIVSATFTAPTSRRDGSAFNIIIRGANLDNAGTLLTGTNLTTAQVTVSAPSAGTNLSVDVTAIVQEITGRAGWGAGNAIVLYLLGTNAGSDNNWRMSADTGGSLVINYT